MEDILRILVFVLFVLAPIIEQLRRKRQQPPPQQRPLPQPRVEDARTRTPVRTQQPVEASRTEDTSAAAMLPDELWEILTGQPKPKPARSGPYAPAPDVEDEVVVDEEAVIREEAQVPTRRRRSFDEAVSLEKMPRRAPPEVVSMEGPPPAPAVRHAAFHAKVDPGSAPNIAEPIRPEIPELRRPRDLRKALLAHTILGPPKALE
jgi:hypothetical protein